MQVARDRQLHQLVWGSAMATSLVPRPAVPVLHVRYYVLVQLYMYRMYYVLDLLVVPRPVPVLRYYVHVAHVLCYTMY